MVVTNRLLAQSVEMGVLPQLYAATQSGRRRAASTSAPTGSPSSAGIPKPVGSSGAARDEKAARRLWEVSEELTGVSFELPVAAAS